MCILSPEYVDLYLDHYHLCKPDMAPCLCHLSTPIVRCKVRQQTPWNPGTCSGDKGETLSQPRRKARINTKVVFDITCHAWQVSDSCTWTCTHEYEHSLEYKHTYMHMHTNTHRFLKRNHYTFKSEIQVKIFKDF